MSRQLGADLAVDNGLGNCEDYGLAHSAYIGGCVFAQLLQIIVKNLHAPEIIMHQIATDKSWLGSPVHMLQ